MKSLNLKQILGILFMAAIAFTACSKKDSIPAPQPTIEGSWLGKYGNGNNAPVTFYSFNLLKGGVLEVRAQDNTVKGSGTWELNGEIFTAKYQYNVGFAKYNMAAKYDANAKTLTGSWVSGDTVADDGEFFLNKQ